MFELFLLSFPLYSLFYLLSFFLYAFPDFFCFRFFAFRTHPTPPPATLNASLKNFNWLVSWTSYFGLYVFDSTKRTMRTLILQFIHKLF